jgi:biotin operon repressor
MLPAAQETTLLDALLRTLQSLPDVQIEIRPADHHPDTAGRPDAEFRGTVAGKPVRILIEAKKTLFPRDVRQVLWQLREFDATKTERNDRAELPVWMLVSDSISPGAQEMLKAERVGYYDGASLFLPAPGAYLYIEKPPVKAIQKAIGSLFSGRRAQVSHALLLHAREWFSGQKLAQQAQVSPATVSQVMTELERQDWVAAIGEGPNKQRRLEHPGRLLDHWVQHLSSRRPLLFRRLFVPQLKAERLQDSVGRVFDFHAVTYAVSFEAAAQRYAPYLSSISQVRCRVSPGPPLEAALTELNARAVIEGANFSVIETTSPGEMLFREQLEGIWCASPIQVYIDLSRSDGRAKEMAQNLRRERIGF